MILVDILVVLILIFSFIGGLRGGAVKSAFSLAALIIAIPVTGAVYHVLAGIISFLPGKNWENFLGFLITLCLIQLMLFIVFFLPRKFLERLWNRGFLSRLIGGAITTLNAAIGMVVLTLLITAYPIMGWLERAMTGSSVLSWLIIHLSFVRAMLPEMFQLATHTIAAGPALILVIYNGL